MLSSYHHQTNSPVVIALPPVLITKPFWSYSFIIYIHRICCSPLSCLQGTTQHLSTFTLFNAVFIVKKPFVLSFSNNKPSVYVLTVNRPLPALLMIELSEPLHVGLIHVLIIVFFNILWINNPYQLVISSFSLTTIIVAHWIITLQTYSQMLNLVRVRHLLHVAPPCIVSQAGVCPEPDPDPGIRLLSHAFHKVFPWPCHTLLTGSHTPRRTIADLLFLPSRWSYPTCLDSSAGGLERWLRWG